MSKFQDAVWNASLSSLQPQVSLGPDGFNYLNLCVPKYGEPFDTFSLNYVAEKCLNGGFGVTIFLNEANFIQSKPEFVFSAGLLDSLFRFKKLNGFTLDDVQYPKPSKDNFHQIEEGAVLFSGKPSNKLLPIYTCKHIGNILRAYGFNTPKIALTYSEEFGYFITLNCQEANFASKEIIEGVFLQIGWFLLPGIGITLMDRTMNIDHFIRICSNQSYDVCLW